MSLALVYSRLCGMNARRWSKWKPTLPTACHISISSASPDTEVKESRDRVRAAIIQKRFRLPRQENYRQPAPADLPKESAVSDLPIAYGHSAASGQINPEKLAQYEFAGELALSGLLRPGTRRAGHGMAGNAGRSFVSSYRKENAEQAAVMRGIAVYGARSLGEVAAHLNGIEPLTQTECKLTQRPSEQSKIPDLADVKAKVYRSPLL